MTGIAAVKSMHVKLNYLFEKGRTAIREWNLFSHLVICQKVYILWSCVLLLLRWKSYRKSADVCLGNAPKQGDHIAAGKWKLDFLCRVWKGIEDVYEIVRAIPGNWNSSMDSFLWLNYDIRQKEWKLEIYNIGLQFKKSWNYTFEQSRNNRYTILSLSLHLSHTYTHT